MLRDAVPYDFGGIDVIDVLTYPPPKKTADSKTSEEETTTQSTMSGPEEPSLTNVVTAAEDFIKVLATVSTSQSSATDSDKGETQSSEKKKKKKKKEKTHKKHKGKGKGRKRKQKVEAGVKIDEGAAVSTTGSKAEEVVSLSNFINESSKHEQSSRNTHRVSDSEYELRRKDEQSNEVMKDEPAKDKETISITSPAMDQQKPTEKITILKSTTAGPKKTKPRGLRKQGRKRSKTLPPPTEGVVTNATDISVPATDSEQQSLESNTETRPVATTARTLVQVKRTRSKERGDRDGRKKRKKGSSASPIVDTPQENSSEDGLKVIPLSGVPTVAAVPTMEQQVSHRLDVYRRKTGVHVTSLNSTFSVLKKRKSQERGLKSRRRKTLLPPSSGDQLFHGSSGNVLPVLPTVETSNALTAPTTSAGVHRPTAETQTHSEWRLFTTAAPPVVTKRPRQTIRQQRKPRRKAAPAALSDGVSVPKQTEQTPVTFTTTPSAITTTQVLHLHTSEQTSTITTTSTSPAMSPIQLSMARARAQFSRKKRRKVSIRQQRGASAAG